MEEEIAKPKKKRGRKPKKKAAIKEKNDEEKQSNMVIRLSSIPGTFEQKKMEINEGYEANKKNENVSGKQKTGNVCWNCCHEFDSIITGIPIKQVDGIFYTYGDFCSLECCSRYAFEYFKDDYWEILSNINLYNHEIYGKFTPIEMAPSKLVLKKFGGDLDINEYRTKKNIHEIQLPPILPINHTDNIYEKKINNYENLKLFRKKKLPSDKKSITNSMNLIVSS